MKEKYPNAALPVIAKIGAEAAFKPGPREEHRRDPADGRLTAEDPHAARLEPAGMSYPGVGADFS